MGARQLGVVIGNLAPGADNAITDVADVRVGHVTLIEGQDVRTGVTVVVPHGGDPGRDPVFAGCHRLNGNGEVTGLEWLRESGMLTTPIGITNTHSVGVARDAIVSAGPPALGRWSLPVVGETYDGFLNDINGQHIRADHVHAALRSASAGPVAEGCVGGGTGMICHGFKGGAGTASRVLGERDGGFTVGVLVQANHGQRSRLRVNGVPIGERIGPDLVPLLTEGGADGAGSIIVVVATDAPLLPGQRDRLAQRAVLGIGRTGGMGEHSSGDFVVCFATGNRGLSAEKGERRQRGVRTSVRAAARGAPAMMPSSAHRARPAAAVGQPAATPAGKRAPTPRREDTGRLTEYRRKRHPDRTPEPMPGAGSRKRAAPIFVVQEHHASALHWDFRLERDGVLVSWAVPKGIPDDPKTNHLAVHTEDHPLEYATFEGTIVAGEYGGGEVTIWDRGSYVTEKWTDREVKVVLSGARTTGRFVLFQTGGKNWMMHRMDAPVREDWHPAPDQVSPMLATPGSLPPAREDPDWAYEMKWDGVRAVARVDGGRVSATSRDGRDITVRYPELRRLGEQLGSSSAVLDGEIVSFDPKGRPDFGRLQQRMHVAGAAQARRLAERDPVVYLIFDLLYFEGHVLFDLPYAQRRELLEELRPTGPAWQTPPAFAGSGADAVRASQNQGLEGVVAKRLSSRYRPGQRSPDWVKVKNIRAQEVVVGGWKPGRGRRARTVGSLLLGVYGADGLAYVGNVGTGFTDAMLDDLAARLSRLDRATSPFAEQLPAAERREVHWVSPRLVGEVAFTEWTGQRRLRHPAWRGLRPDKAPADVSRED